MAINSWKSMRELITRGPKNMSNAEIDSAISFCFKEGNAVQDYNEAVEYLISVKKDRVENKRFYASLFISLASAVIAVLSFIRSMG